MSTTSADNYALVTTLHAAEAALVEARLAAARDPARADAVPAAEAAASAARAAVDAALADGRVLSACNISALPWDCLGAIFQRLDPRDVARCEAACPTFRAAAARAATPSAVSFLGDDEAAAAAVEAGGDTLQAVLRRLRALAGEPAAAVRSVTLSAELEASALGGDLLAAALDAAPGTTHVQLGRVNGDAVDALAARRDRGFSVGVGRADAASAAQFARLAAAVRVVSVGVPGNDFQGVDFADAAITLTQLEVLGLPPRRGGLPHLPHVRRLVLATDYPDFPEAFETVGASLPALADLAFRPESDNVDEHSVPKTFGSAGLWASLSDRLTRLDLAATAVTTDVDLAFVSALSRLRDLRLDWQRSAVVPIVQEMGFPGLVMVHYPTEEDITMLPLPMLAPSVTRLVTSGAARFVCGNLVPDTAPGLRVLDRRNSSATFATFLAEADPEEEGNAGQGWWPLDVPRAAAAPALQTLLLGYDELASTEEGTGCGGFNLASLLGLAPTLTTVVIENAWLSFSLSFEDPSSSAPLDASAANRVTAMMQGELPNLRSLHVHSCTLFASSAGSVAAFFAELTRRGVHVCYAPAEECVACQLLDAELGEW